MIIFNDVTISQSVVTTQSQFVLSVGAEWLTITWQKIADELLSWRYIADTYKTWRQVMDW